MKSKLFLIVVLLAVCEVILAQVPQAFKYQAVVRNNNGDILQNQNIGLKVSILKGSTTGTVVYSETHAIQTNEFGLINIEIGNGTVFTGDFAIINWGSDSYFIKTEIDAAGGTNYQELAVNQLLSVPYALYSKQSENAGQWIGNADSITYFGNVGIGVTNPSEKLIVGDGIALDQGIGINASNTPYLRFQRGDSNKWGILENTYGDDGILFFDYINNTARVIFRPDGNVGIGTINPTHKLSVVGTIRAYEVIVNTGWSDFVFDKDYNLIPLPELEEYVIAKKHLPDIPTAKEVDENGVSLGEMDSKLLQKIEELTLYIIDLQKQINDLKQQNVNQINIIENEK